MGLREIKKKRARDSILNSARELFFSRGFSGTTIEAIAEKAEVAVGTVYNYFESKSGIILAITEEDTSAALEGEYSIPDSASPREAVSAYLDTFMENLSLYPKRLLAELIRETCSSSGGSLRKGLIEQDFTLIGSLERLLNRLKDSGGIKPDTDIQNAALVIYGTVITSILWYATDPERKPAEMTDSLQSMLRVVFNGLSKGAE
ncbi:MAG: TetR family transcriptional regulator [Candidatus Aegiribacteria sp.]|nr:TetR family transcriptional regulator [Candidatus Aegiribacteria sp.]MBD3294432.1 TetR family transcriptional regulator [Candidatus Fermentibacteria bacterium]